MPFYAEKIYICSVNRPERVVAGPAGYMLQGFPPAWRNRLMQLYIALGLTGFDSR